MPPTPPCKLARGGTPFREAYRQVAESLRSGSFTPPVLSESCRQSELLDMLKALEADAASLGQSIAAARCGIHRAETELFAAK